jgi:hypothetical protein
MDDLVRKAASQEKHRPMDLKNTARWTRVEMRIAAALLFLLLHHIPRLLLSVVAPDALISVSSQKVAPYPQQTGSQTLSLLLLLLLPLLLLLLLSVAEGLRTLPSGCH